MKAIVTGGTGFIGRNLIRHLLACGAQVSCLARKPQRSALNGVRFVACDLRNRLVLPRSLQCCDVVFHLAGVTRASHRDAYISGNQRTTANLIEGLKRQVKTSSHVVCVSSLSASGPCARHPGRHERHRPTPVSDYGESKLMSEKAAAAWEDHGPLSIIRLPAVYGPGDRNLQPLAGLVGLGVLPLLYGKAFPISLLHVDDVCRGLLKAAAMPAMSRRLLHFSSQRPYPWQVVAEHVARAMKRRVLPVRFPAWSIRVLCWAGSAGTAIGAPAPYLISDRWKEIRCEGWVADGSRALKELGFEARIDMQQGMHASIDWYANAGRVKTNSFTHPYTETGPSYTNRQGRYGR